MKKSGLVVNCGFLATVGNPTGYRTFGYLNNGTKTYKVPGLPLLWGFLPKKKSRLQVVQLRRLAASNNIKIGEIKVKCGEFHIWDNTSSNVKLDIWQKFGEVKDNENNTVSGS